MWNSVEATTTINHSSRMGMDPLEYLDSQEAGYLDSKTSLIVVMIMVGPEIASERGEILAMALEAGMTATIMIEGAKDGRICQAKVFGLCEFYVSRYVFIELQ
jgi:hypothetical protein